MTATADTTPATFEERRALLSATAHPRSAARDYRITTATGSTGCIIDTTTS